jgi:hypothetical protein
VSVSDLLLVAANDRGVADAITAALAAIPPPQSELITVGIATLLENDRCTLKPGDESYSPLARRLWDWIHSLKEKPTENNKKTLALLSALGDRGISLDNIDCSLLPYVTDITDQLTDVENEKVLKWILVTLVAQMREVKQSLATSIGLDVDGDGDVDVDDGASSSVFGSSVPREIKLWLEMYHNCFNGLVDEDHRTLAVKAAIFLVLFFSVGDVMTKIASIKAEKETEKARLLEEKRLEELEIADRKKRLAILRGQGYVFITVAGVGRDCQGHQILEEWCQMMDAAEEKIVAIEKVKSKPVVLLTGGNDSGERVVMKLEEAEAMVVSGSRLPLLHINTFNPCIKGECGRGETRRFSSRYTCDGPCCNKRMYAALMGYVVAHYKRPDCYENCSLTFSHRMDRKDLRERGCTCYEYVLVNNAFSDVLDGDEESRLWSGDTSVVRAARGVYKRELPSVVEELEF